MKWSLLPPAGNLENKWPTVEANLPFFAGAVTKFNFFKFLSSFKYYYRIDYFGLNWDYL